MIPLAIHRAASLPLGARTLQAGCRGQDVDSLQRALAALGYLSEIDGDYGLVTEAAVSRLQRDHRLIPDGVAGPATFVALREAAEGAGYICRRTRPGEDLDRIAAELKLSMDALSRQNHLRPGAKSSTGAMLRVSRRLLLSGAGEEPPAYPCTAKIGPVFDLDEPVRAVESGDWPAANLPMVRVSAQTWARFLRRPEEGAREAATACRVLAARRDRRWLLPLPAGLWLRRRRIRLFLRTLATAGSNPIPVIEWPAPPLPLPDLRFLAADGDYAVLDPGTAAFSGDRLRQLLRLVITIFPARRLLVQLRAGGLLRGPRRSPELLPVREARAAAILDRARLVWDHAALAYRAANNAPEDPWQLTLIEERALRERARLIDRLGLAGVVVAGLAGVYLPQPEIWPGEFAVADSFPPPRHIH